MLHLHGRSPFSLFPMSYHHRWVGDPLSILSPRVEYFYYHSSAVARTKMTFWHVVKSFSRALQIL